MCYEGKYFFKNNFINIQNLNIYKLIMWIKSITRENLIFSYQYYIYITEKMYRNYTEKRKHWLGKGKNINK